MKVAVILPAAGLGTRMAKSQPEAGTHSRKQFLQLEGVPILLHTIRKFAQCGSVTEIIVALRGEDIAWVQELLDQESLGKPVRLVVGGESRQQSVENALGHLTEDTELVAVHDAVRPFVELEAVEKVIDEAGQCGAAILGIVPVDTVKRVHLNRIETTIPRERLVMAQTPQVFRMAILKEAFAKATADGFVGTDEASLVERLDNVNIHVVPGSDRNIKITKPTDLYLAKLFHAEEKERRGE
ncbi:MAG TPA: 2-C-methyl-D-erythritol 4-phosphate cytidylyltransferase [Bryobacteraceae bacterium]|nr:2-C-methyl-D-erythritol 4-phosphate cytidylyltransferase [Bryobacteraceae bacterium]